MCPACVCVCMCGTDESELRCTYSFNSLDNGHSFRPSHIPVAVTSHNQHRSHSYIRLFAPRGNKQHSIDSRGPCCATLYPYLPPSLPLPFSTSLALPYRVTLLYICHAHNEVEQKCFTAKKPLGLLYTSLASSRFLSPSPSSFILLPHRVSKPQSRHPAKRQRGTTRTVSVSILFLPFFNFFSFCASASLSSTRYVCVCRKNDTTTSEWIALNTSPRSRPLSDEALCDDNEIENPFR